MILALAGQFKQLSHMPHMPRMCSLNCISQTILSFTIPLTNEANKLTSANASGFIAQLVKALPQHRRGHGFESRWRNLKFFRCTYVRQVLKWSRKCESHFFHSSLSTGLQKHFFHSMNTVFWYNYCCGIPFSLDTI